MGYQTLYRKYRSRTFTEIVGQEHVVGILRGALSRGRVAHAYLFSGPRGTGKTSIARIFAKALNCPDVKDGEPCGVCHVCTSITEGRAPDVIEMDAASNRGVESIEELRRGVQFVPQELKYKVYIIDEVHMISPAGFNALLKTLEEPPSHAIFILATTESHKLPITILSRCLRFEFRRIPYKQLSAHLIKITKKEGNKITEDAAHLLAELAEGSARDSISLLDQLIIATDGEITVEFVRSILGLTHPTAITAIVRKLVDGDLKGLTDDFHQFIVEGRDPEYFLELFYEKMRDGYLGITNDDELVTLLSRIPHEKLLACIEALWDSFGMLRRTNHPTGLIELTLFKLGAILAGKTVSQTAVYDEAGDSEDEQESVSDEMHIDSTEPDTEPPVDIEDSGSEIKSMQERAVESSAESVQTRKVDPRQMHKQFLKEKEQGINLLPLDNDSGSAEKRPPFPDNATAGRGESASTAVPESEGSANDTEPDEVEPPIDAYEIPTDFDGDTPVDTTQAEKEESGAEQSRKVVEKQADRDSLTPAEKAKLTRETFKKAGFEPLKKHIWDALLERLHKEYFPTYCLLRPDAGVVPIMITEKTLYLVFGADDLLIRNFARTGRHKRAVESLLLDITGERYEIVFDPSEAKELALDDAALIKLREAQLMCLVGG